MALLLFQRCLPRLSSRFSTQNVKYIATETSQSLRVKSHICCLSQCNKNTDLLNVDKIPKSCCNHSQFIFTRKFHVSNCYYNEVVIVNTPSFADSISDGDVKLEKAVGDFVKEDDVVCEIETDKTSVPVPSPKSGIVEEYLVEDGQTVTAGTPLFKLKITDAAVDSAPKSAPAAETPSPTQQPPQPPKAEAVPASSTSGPIPTTPPPAPPLPKEPISTKPLDSIKPKSAPASQNVPLSGSRSETKVNMSRIRQRTAQRLKQAQNECAMLTTFNEIDMSNIIDLRKQYKETFLKKFGLKLGFMSAFVKASAYALTDQPVVNAVIDNKEILYRDYIDISVAVSTPKGLVVPVIRSVEKMNYADIEKEIASLGEKARTGSLAIEDMEGGTFTISNGGVFGSLFGTPIINPPQSAILGMHAVNDKPVAINGKVEIRPIMVVALTYDHRLIDGREAVTFLKKIKSAVEDPRVILLDL